MRNEQRALEKAISLHRKGDIAAAAEQYRQIIRENPLNSRALHFLGAAEATAGELDRAKSLMARSLQLDPANIEFIENFAAVLQRAGDHEAAIKLCRDSLQSAPSSLTLLHVGAAALLARGRYSEALVLLDQLLIHQPNHLPGNFMRASALAKAKRYDEALVSYRRVLALHPHAAEANLDIGTIHFTNQRFEDALSAYDAALSLRPTFAEAWLGRGFTLIKLGRAQDALAAMGEAVASSPGSPDAWIGRGNAYFELGRFQDAAAAYDRAVRSRPAAALSGQGNAFLRLGRLGDADAAFSRAIEADATFAEAWLGRGTLLAAAGRHLEALIALDKALVLDPTLNDAWIARGQLHYLEKRYDEALADWTRALALKADQPVLEAACLRVRMHLCDWPGFDAACGSVRSAIGKGVPIAPFLLVAIPSSAAEQLRCAKRWIEHNFNPVDRAPWPGERHGDRRIHIAYVSADFHQHATSYLMAGLFEHHDKSRFKVTGISVGPNDRSAMRARIEAAFEQFVDAQHQRDDQIAELVRALEVDILVDLKGFTQNARTGVFAMRAAPIQVNYLGFPGTIGASFIDYIIADNTVLPMDECSYYAEKVVWLPDSYQVNDGRRTIADATPTRAEVGLPENCFVFCCFNDNYKIIPDVFSIWMRVLQSVPDSVLWLYEDNPRAAGNLRLEAAARGVDPSRLIFARRLPNAEHLARHRCADLFLDTLPYGAHTTASDALWAGLPVLTRIGETFAGRVGASLLRALQLPELITTTPDEYETLAIELAGRPTVLSSLKAKLARNRLITPLFDTALFTRHLEAAYNAMMERHRADLPPDHIQLNPRRP